MEVIERVERMREMRRVTNFESVTADTNWRFQDCLQSSLGVVSRVKGHKAILCLCHWTLIRSHFSCSGIAGDWVLIKGAQREADVVHETVSGKL